MAIIEATKQIKEQYSTAFHAIIFTTIILSIFLAAQFLDYKNVPDWQGYRLLLETNGGWLQAASRDPLFILIIEFSNNVVGYGKYEEFRILSYFIISIFIFISIRNIKIQHNSDSWFNYLLITLFFLSAFFSKYLVQIREGIALSLSVLSIVILLSEKKHKRIAAFILSILSYFFHSGYLPITLVISFSCVFCNRRILIVIFQDYKKYVVSISVLLGFISSLFINSNPYFAYDYIGDTFVEARFIQESGLFKLFYWAIYGGLILHLQLLVNSSPSNAMNATTGLVTSILMFSLLPFLYFLCFGLTLLGFEDGSQIASFARLLNAIVNVSIAALIMEKRAKWTVVAITLFFFVDQIRILQDSVPF